MKSLLNIIVSILVIGTMAVLPAGLIFLIIGGNIGSYWFWCFLGMMFFFIKSEKR